MQGAIAKAKCCISGVMPIWCSSQQRCHTCSSLLKSPVQAEKPKAEDVKAAKASKAPAASSSSSATAAPASSGPSAAASEPAAASDSATQSQPPAKAAAAADGAAPKKAAKKVGAGLCMSFCIACCSSPTPNILARAEPCVVSMAHTARKCCDCYPGLAETVILLLPVPTPLSFVLFSNMAKHYCIGLVRACMQYCAALYVP